MEDLIVTQDIPKIPHGLAIDKIREHFPKPCLLEIPGQSEETVFVSTLLHGNETTSFAALKHLLEAYSDRSPKKTLLILVGNVEAASLSKRVMQGQQDFNRIWSEGSSTEHQWAQQVKNYVEKRSPLFACIDIHNNSGKNPFYSCLSELTDPFVYLAGLFSPTLVYFRNPDSVLSTNFSPFGPSITIECGESGNLEGENKAIQLIEDVLHAESLNHKTQDSDIHIFQTLGRIVVNPQAKVAFGRELGDLHFSDQVESLNFVQQPEGALLCRSERDPVPLQILDLQGNDLFDQYCVRKGDEIRWRQPIIPSMFTRDTKVIYQDCFGYVMEPITR